MKRFIAIVASFVLVCTSLVLAVQAHPGRTDGSGGHTNHSTGEYHYHHGYSAHDHYDMDGDGDADCPYDFHDKTDHSSGSGNSSSSNSSSGFDIDISSLPTLDLDDYTFPTYPKVEISSTHKKPTTSGSDSGSNDTFSTIAAIVVVLGFWTVPMLINRK